MVISITDPQAQACTQGIGNTERHSVDVTCNGTCCSTGAAQGRAKEQSDAEIH